MAKYKKETVKRSDSTIKVSDAVVCHFGPTQRAMAMFFAALSKSLTVDPATLYGLFLAAKNISYCKIPTLFVSRA